LRLTKAQKALEEMLGWSGDSEIDLYPYVRELFAKVFGYPKDHIHLVEKGNQGKVPDLALVSADVSLTSNTYWVVGEVKRERGVFRSRDYRKEQWEKQLKDCVSADTDYALFIDPITIAVLRPDGSEIEVVELDKHSVVELLSPMAENSLAPLRYENSVEDHRAHRVHRVSGVPEDLTDAHGVIDKKSQSIVGQEPTHYIHESIPVLPERSVGAP